MIVVSGRSINLRENDLAQSRRDQERKRKKERVIVCVCLIVYVSDYGIVFGCVTIWQYV